MASLNLNSDGTVRGQITEAHQGLITITNLESLSGLLSRLSKRKQYEYQTNLNDT